MADVKDAFFGERSLTKVAGLFNTRSEAENAARHLLQDSDLDDSQVRVLSPDDGSVAHNTLLARKMEPEQSGIWHTIIRAHVTTGILGALAGIALYLALMSTGHPIMRSTPGMSLVAMAGFGATFGLLVGGLLAMRPDHGRVINLVRKALKNGRWAVVAHPVNAGQTHRAVDLLKQGSLRVVRSL